MIVGWIPNCTSYLQSPDVFCFGPFKSIRDLIEARLFSGKKVSRVDKIALCMESYRKTFTFQACRIGLEQSGMLPFTRVGLLKMAITNQGDVIRNAQDGEAGMALIRHLTASSSETSTPMTGESSSSSPGLTTPVALWNDIRASKPRLGKARYLYDSDKVSESEEAEAVQTARNNLLEIREKVRLIKSERTTKLFQEIEKNKQKMKVSHEIKKRTLETEYRRKLEDLDSEYANNIQTEEGKVEEYHASIVPLLEFISLLQSKLESQESEKERKINIALVLEKSSDMLLGYTNETLKNDPIALINLKLASSPLKNRPGYSTTPLKRILSQQVEQHLLTVKQKKQRVDTNRLRAFKLINHSGTVEMSSVAFREAVTAAVEYREKKAADKAEAAKQKQAKNVNINKEKYDRLTATITKKLNTGSKLLVSELRPWLKSAKYIEDKKTTKRSETLSKRLTKILSYKGEQFSRKAIAYVTNDLKVKEAVNGKENSQSNSNGN